MQMLRRCHTSRSREDTTTIGTLLPAHSSCVTVAMPSLSRARRARPASLSVRHDPSRACETLSGSTAGAGAGAVAASAHPTAASCAWPVASPSSTRRRVVLPRDMKGDGQQDLFFVVLWRSQRFALWRGNGELQSKIGVGKGNGKGTRTLKEGDEGNLGAEHEPRCATQTSCRGTASACRSFV